MRRGQSGVMDAMIFMVITTGAVGMLLYVSGLYAESTNRQVLSSYSFEYAGNALVALHYARDDNSDWFWEKLGEHASSSGDVQEYLKENATSVISNITLSSPAPENYLCVLNSSALVNCYNLTEYVEIVEVQSASPNPCGPGRQSYSYAVPLDERRDVLMVLCY